MKRSTFITWDQLKVGAMIAILAASDHRPFDNKRLEPKVINWHILNSELGSSTEGDRFVEIADRGVNMEAFHDSFLSLAFR